VLDGLNYYLGITDIPDDRVVHELLGVPTYLLHEAIDVRAPAVLWVPGGDAGLCAGAQAARHSRACPQGRRLRRLGHSLVNPACLPCACRGRLASW
jgi:hypothetical protein